MQHLLKKTVAILQWYIMGSFSYPTDHITELPTIGHILIVSTLTHPLVTVEAA